MKSPDGKFFAAALGRDRFDLFVAAAVRRARDSRRVALILIRLERFELLLLMLELFLLLLDQLVGGFDLIAHASCADEGEHAEREGCDGFVLSKLSHVWKLSWRLDVNRIAINTGD